MITKAVIKEIVSEYEVKVYIPLLHSAPITGNNIINDKLDKNLLVSAFICCSPKARFIPKINDIVFLAFEDYNLGNPIIIGCLFKESGNLSNIDMNITNLSVEASTKLSQTTTIGDITYKELYSLKNMQTNIDQELLEIKQRLYILEHPELQTTEEQPEE